jgi:hypothetical protein
MRRARLVSLGFVLLLSTCSRGHSTAPTSETSTPAQPTPQAPAERESNSSPAPEVRTSEIPYTKDKRLSYAGYVITVERKRVKVEEFSAENEVAVLKKNGRIIRAFDAVRHPLGAFTRLALVPLLGDRYKQLIIEQTGPREWACWVMALKPHFRVIFDNTEYPVDHELGAEDLDGDGVPELLMTLNTFWFFDGLCGACSPRFAIAFKYDRNRGVFRPANHILKGLCETADQLAEAEQTIKLWQSQNTDLISNPIKASELYSKVLIHSLPLLYCGREALGWSFFNRLYNLPDRAVRKSRIKRTLRRDRVYRVIQFDLKRSRREASLHRAGVSG